MIMMDRVLQIFFARYVPSVVRPGISCVSVFHFEIFQFALGEARFLIFVTFGGTVISISSIIEHRSILIFAFIAPLLLFFSGDFNS